MTTKRLALLAFIIFIPIVGYAFMHGLVLLFPMESNFTIIYASIAFIVTVVGLTIPYLMVKAGFSMAHLGNANEKEIELEDLPKDDEQLRK